MNFLFIDFEGGENGYPARIRSGGLKIIMRTVTFLTIFLPINRVVKTFFTGAETSTYISSLPLSFKKRLAPRLISSLLHFLVLATRFSFTYYAFAVQLLVVLMATTMLKSVRYNARIKLFALTHYNNSVPAMQCRDVFGKIDLNLRAVDELRRNVTELSIVLSIMSSTFAYHILTISFVVTSAGIIFHHHDGGGEFAAEPTSHRLLALRTAALLH